MFDKKTSHVLIRLARAIFSFWTISTNHPLFSESPSTTCFLPNITFHSKHPQNVYRTHVNHASLHSKHPSFFYLSFLLLIKRTRFTDPPDRICRVYSFVNVVGQCMHATVLSNGHRLLQYCACMQVRAVAFLRYALRRKDNGRVGGCIPGNYRLGSFGSFN